MKKTTERNAEVHEWNMIRLPAQGGGLSCQSLLSEIFKKDLLDVLITIQPIEQCVGTVTVVNESDKVGWANHIKVQLEDDIFDVTPAQGIYIELRAEQTRPNSFASKNAKRNLLWGSMPRFAICRAISNMAAEPL